jgi:hypothetical protein
MRTQRSFLFVSGAAVEGCYQATQSSAHGHAPEAHADAEHEIGR